MENIKFYVTYVISKTARKEMTNTLMVFTVEQLIGALNTIKNIGYEVKEIRSEKY